MGTERCLNTDQAFPRLELNGTVDLAGRYFGGSFTGRYISAVRESTGHRMEPTFYGDIQLYLTGLIERTRLVLGVNNVFNKAPPSCYTCDSANFDHTTYDVPGQFGYLRLSYGF